MGILAFWGAYPEELHNKQAATLTWAIKSPILILVSLSLYMSKSFRLDFNPHPINVQLWTKHQHSNSCAIVSWFCFIFQGGKQGSPHMSRKTLDGPAGMIGGAYLPSAALLHEAKLGEDSFTFITFYLSIIFYKNTREKAKHLIP